MTFIKTILSFRVSKVNPYKPFFLSRVTEIISDKTTRVWQKASHWLCFQSEAQATFETDQVRCLSCGTHNPTALARLQGRACFTSTAEALRASNCRRSWTLSQRWLVQDWLFNTKIGSFIVKFTALEC